MALEDKHNVTHGLLKELKFTLPRTTEMNFATSQNVAVNSTMFPHENIHKYTWTSLDGKTHNRLITY